MSNTISDLSPQQLRQAARLKERIEKLQCELDQLLSGGKSKPASSPGRKLSAEGRAKIAAAQKRRWAKKKRARRKSKN